MKETYWKDDVRSVKWTHPVLHSSENWSIAVPVPLLRYTCHSLCSWPMLQQHGPARSALIGHLWASDPNRNWSGWSSLSLRNCLNFWCFWGHWTNKTKREAWDRECMRIGMPWQIDKGYDYRYINAKCTFTAGAVVKWGLESVSQNLTATLLAYNIWTCERDASIPSFKPILDQIVSFQWQFHPEENTYGPAK